MEIKLSSVLVNDQDHALAFYTEVLGFVKKQDIPTGEHRWLTVTSPGSAGGVELLLEPTVFPPAADYQKALMEAGMPITSFCVDDVKKEYKRLKKLKVRFRSRPTKSESVRVAVFEDTCGNLIQIYQG